MPASLTRRSLVTGIGTGGIGVGGLALLAPNALADTPFTSFAFAATGTPALRTMPDRLAEIKNVLDFGADPTGQTDSWRAIQAAINWTSGANRGTIFFPPGTYDVSQPLTFNYNGALSIRFLGAGAASTTITYWHGGGFTGNWIFDRSNVNGGSPNYQPGPIVFESLSVTAQGGASTVGCVRIGSTMGAAFRDCSFSGNVCVTTEDSAGSSSKNVFFDNCRFNNNGTNTPANAVILGGGGALYNCDFVGCDSGIVAYGSGFSINGCRLEDCNTAIGFGKDSGGTARTTSAFSIIGTEFEANLTNIDFLAPCSGFHISGGGIGHDGSAGYLQNATSVYGVNMRAGNAQAGFFEGCNFGGPLTTAAFAIGNASSRANVVFSGCSGSQLGSTGVGWILPTNSYTAFFDNCNTQPIWTFAQLPTGGNGFEGDEFNISDSNTATWGATATGGGSNHVLVRYNGSNWTVVGK
jgi:hypothetical protein